MDRYGDSDEIIRRFNNFTSTRGIREVHGIELRLWKKDKNEAKQIDALDNELFSPLFRIINDHMFHIAIRKIILVHPS